MADERPAALLSFQSGRGVAVDLDRLVSSRLLIQANSGGGKSTLLRYILEQTHGRIQHIVLDPEGEFASLRQVNPYLLAGGDGDVPADPKTAKLLCRRLLELRASAVIDLYDLQLADRRRFVRLFLDELMHLPRSLWRPLLVVLDEAHAFCPERGSGEAESTSAVITLATQGRKRGYALLAATQRLSKLHKDCAAELLNVLIGRTGLDVDAKRAGDMLGFDKDARTSLRALDPGTWYAFGPAIAPSPVLVRTGPTRTKQPRPGEIAPPVPPAPDQVRAVLGQLRELQREAAEEERTIEELRAKNARLERELRAARKAPATPPAEVIDAATKAATVQLRAELGEARAAAERLSGRIHRGRGVAEQLLEVLRNGDAPPTPASAVPVQKHERGIESPAKFRPSPPVATKMLRDSEEVGATVRRRSAPVVDAAGLSTPQRRVLEALAQYRAFGQAEVDRAAAAAVAGYKQGGHFNNTVSALRTVGLLHYPTDGSLALTEAGEKAVTVEPIEFLEQLHERWLSLCNRPQRKVLSTLLGQWPKGISRDELAASVGMSPGGHFNNTVSSLRTLGAAVYPDRGSVRASDLLFPAGLT